MSRRDPSLAPDAGAGKLIPQGVNRLEGEVAPENVNDDAGLLLIDHQLTVAHVVAERRHAAHPHALLLGCGDLVAHALPDDLALELSKGQQDVQRQPSHAGGGVELLGDGDERHAAAVEDIDELGEVGQRARQAIDLVDHDHVDPARLDVGDQPFERGPIHASAGEPAIVIERRRYGPAFVLLGENEGCAGFALGVERVEGLLEPFL